MSIQRALGIVCAILAGAALIAACSDGDEGAPAPSAASSDPTAAADGGFPTGPAVLVPAGYQPPGDRVDSTGAYVPANGKPTLVFVDAIW